MRLASLLGRLVLGLLLELHVLLLGSWEVGALPGPGRWQRPLAAAAAFLPEQELPSPPPPSGGATAALSGPLGPLVFPEGMGTSGKTRIDPQAMEARQARQRAKRP